MIQLPEFKKIIYATALGENTRPIFRTALSIARKYEADIIMLHVVEPMSPAAQAIIDTYLNKDDAKKVYQDGMRAVLKTMRERLTRFCEEELNTSKTETTRVKEMLVVSGKTSEEIIKAAQSHQADLIVIGKSTRNILGNEVAGSTARRVSRYSNVPVLMVPNY